MLLSVSILTALQIVIAFLTMRYSDNFKPYNDTSDPQLWVMIIVNLSVNGPVFLFLMKLLLFHVYLNLQGLTTYQYIVMERERETQTKQKSKVIMQKQVADFKYDQALSDEEKKGATHSKDLNLGVTNIENNLSNETSRSGSSAKESNQPSCFARLF